jgi:anthranilate phosphoribosyltransferase
LGNDTVREDVLRPEDFGLTRYPAEVMRGGNAEENRAITLHVLEGQRTPQRDVVVLNAAAALFVAGLAASIQEGIAQATASIDSGAAYQRLKDLVRVSQSFV